MLITIFTPTYNRANLLIRLYNSLKNQEVVNFDWLIIDDGSTDNTNMVVNGFIAENNKFVISYLYKENGGKHTAINLGLKQQLNELFFIVDSDDYLTNEATKVIEINYHDIKSNNSFAGLSGVRVDLNSQLIGLHPNNIVDSLHVNRKKHGIYGDKAEIYKSKVIMQYSFPVFEGEKFCGEDIVWNRISNDGLMLRYFNLPLVVCEYQKDGLTANWERLISSAPKWNALYIKETIKIKRLNLKQTFGLYSDFVQRHSSKSEDEIATLLDLSLFKLKVIKHIALFYKFLNNMLLKCKLRFAF